MELRDYQVDISNKALCILKIYGMVYLAMQVRTGKTLTALETCKQYGVNRVLFLTKKKAIASVEKDYKNFGYEYLLHVTNYEQLGKFKFDYDIVICDEAHCLGAYPKMSNRSTILKNYLGRTPVIYLSGTPTPEGYSQVFNQFAISKNSIYRGYRNFYQWSNSGYVNITQDRRGVYLVNNYSQADGERIKKDIAPIMLTYTQKECGFNCEVKEYFHEVIDDKIVYLCKKLFVNRVLTFCGGKCIADTPAALMGKLHQLSSGTVICDDYPICFSDTKIRYIKKTFKGKRIGIYYKFQKEKEIILSEYPDATESPEDFQHGKYDTFISQIQSGREGIALHSADAIVFYAIDYSAVSYFQARARLQDLKRETPAEVHWIFTKGGIEKKVYAAVSKKKDFTFSYFMKNGNIND